jgi:glycolate oxidase FAD binding subunit
VTTLMAVKELAEQIRDHASKRHPLRIVGGNSKHFYGYDLAELPELSSASLSKIVSYEPSELVLRVEAGCPLATINDALRQEGQMLGFEPPDFGGSTIGGAIASGIAGSRRPFAGAGRDFLLGVGMIDGEGEVFSFGGQVMKNVAGYDVSRLMAGALGCLGFITEVSLKVLPIPALELSISRALSREQFLPEAKKLTALPEVTAVAWWQDKIHVRYSGSEQTVKLRVADGGGDVLDNDFWHQLDTLALFAETETLQRISCKPMDQNSGLEAATLIDWAGAQRWILNEVLTSKSRDAHSTLVKSNDSAGERFTPLAPPIAAIHRKLKQTFDPKGILNPNKMYEGI